MPDSVKDAEMKSLHDILEEITGIVPDTGKTLEEYREERILERYGVSIPVPASCDAADGLQKNHDCLRADSYTGFRPFLCTQYVNLSVFYIPLLAFT